MISIIAAIGKNNELGKKNQLLWSLPADLKHFKEITSGHPIIMGSKTFESIGRPLPNRRNIVITRDLNYQNENVEVVYSIDDALKLFENTNEEVFVIGGGEIYKQMMNHANKLYITEVYGEDSEADTYFPVIDKSIWHEKSRLKNTKDENNKFDFDFVEYVK